MVKKLIPILLILLLLILNVVPVHADTLRISQMEISIWPEYDRPETLVIYRISFSSITDFPARISIRIPSSAGTPYLVAMKDLDGLLYDLEYTLTSDGSWNRIEFIASSPDLQIEFYDPVTQTSDAKRQYSYRWLSDYPIDSLKIEVQKPKYASTLTIEPDFGNGQVNPDDGLTYFVADVGNVSQGVVVNVKLTYLKTNDELSASLTPVHAVNPISRQNNPWEILKRIAQSIFENRALTNAGILLLAAILLFLGANLLAARLQRKKLTWLLQPLRPKPDSAETIEQNATYCHQCGKRAKPGDLFCRVCGSKLIQG
jgi:hypothetical protein